MVGKLSARVPDLAHLDVLVEWLAEFQTLFFGMDQANLRFCSQPLSNTSSTPQTAIYLETSDVQFAAGSTRVFGEFHLDTAPVMADDDDDILRFCERARQYCPASQPPLWAVRSDSEDSPSRCRHQEQRSADSPKGVLLDFNFALDLDNVRPVEPMVGSDGFMAIGILSGQRHRYRHDLESLFYVFLWIAIASDGVHDEANDILEDMPKTSRLWKWCSMDFGAVGRDRAADMSPEGFEGILDEFCSDFAPLRGLAKELHALLFPVRQGKIFTGMDTDPVAVEMLHGGMAMRSTGMLWHSRVDMGVSSLDHFRGHH
ncbi:Protein kinase-like domain protein, partial [Metarhizium majus ARSEF 297]